MFGSTKVCLDFSGVLVLVFVRASVVLLVLDDVVIVVLGFGLVVVFLL